MRRLESWLFAPGDPRRLAAVRIGLCAMLAARLTRGIYLELAQQPPALYRPISFMKLLDRMPPRGFVLALQIIGVAAAVVAAAGLRTRLALPAAWACGVALGGMTTSIGKVVHNDVMLLLAMVPLLAASSADAWSLDVRGAGKREPSVCYGWPLRVAMIVVAGGYFFTGLHKLINAGPAWVTSGNLRWILYISSDGQATPNPWALFIADRAWLAHLAAAGTLALEIGFPIVLWRPRAARLFLPGIVAMHLGIRLAMRLDYAPWIVTAVVVFVDWPGVLERVREMARLRMRAPAGTRIR